MKLIQNETYLFSVCCLQVRYDEELRQYLKTNGLHPSDLIKARTKKKESRTPDKRNASSASHNTSTHHQSAASRNASATSAAAALSPTGQQLVHALVGYQDGSAGQQRSNTASAANSAALPNFSQAWAAGQPMQQILAQMGLTGQVYANADGTISVDNANLASLLALQPQLLSQAQIYTYVVICRLLADIDELYTVYLVFYYETATNCGEILKLMYLEN